MAVMRRAVVIAVLTVVACGEQRISFQPIIDLPPASSDAYPLDDVDTLKLSVAESGEDDDIASKTGTPESPPVLDGVPFGEDLVLHLSGETAGVEIAYGRSCPFAVPGDTLEPHLYFSRIVKWGETADPFEPTRTRGHAYPFACGAVIVEGATPGLPIEMFDAVVGDFQLLQASLLQRTDTVLVAFPGGRALIIGGFDGGGRRVQVVELFDPGIALVEEDVGPQVTEHAAATLFDGSIIVAGGRSETTVTGEAWQFVLNEAGRLENPTILFNEMITPRAGHTMTRLRDLGTDVLIVGGRDTSDNPVAQAELYRPSQEAFLPVASLQFPRYGHKAVQMPDGVVLIVGGFAPSPVRELEIYDAVEGVFKSAGDMPAGAGLTELSVTRLPDDRILLAGGRDEMGRKVATVHIARLDPIDRRVIVVATDAMDVPRAGHTAVLLGDGTVLVVGGTDDASARAERYNPPSEGRR